jgi:hypothetical protein
MAGALSERGVILHDQSKVHTCGSVDRSSIGEAREGEAGHHQGTANGSPFFRGAQGFTATCIPILRRLPFLLWFNNGPSPRSSRNLIHTDLPLFRPPRFSATTTKLPAVPFSRPWRSL